jgi:Mrp family chromosome partitioning ATPase
MTGMDASLTRVKPEQRMTFVTESAEPNAPAVTDSQTTHIIAVASGIRGVGKSSIAGLLAVALNRNGLRVGLFDADSTSTNIPRMFGVYQQPVVIGSEGFVPVESPGGITLMALNWLLSGEGSRARPDPAISRIIEQFWRDVVFGRLDYLIVDLPPGTSDVALTVIQSLPLDGVVLITSPRDTADMALREAASMFKHSGVPLIGLVDNMRHVVCPACGTGIYVFGPGQADFSAQLLETQMLGRMPLDPELACLGDAGAIEDYRSPELDSITKKVHQLVTAAVSETSGKHQPADRSRGR